MKKPSLTDTLIKAIRQGDKRRILSIKEQSLSPAVLKHPVALQGTAEPIAIHMIRAGYTFTRPELLEVWLTEKGWTVAHEMARQGHAFEPEKCRDILMLQDRRGYSVAHEMARQGHVFDPDKHAEIIRMRTRNGLSVGYLTTEVQTGGFKDLSRLWFDPVKHSYILSLCDDSGKAVAYHLVINGFELDPVRHAEVLGESVGLSTLAHLMVANGYFFDPERYEKILSVKNVWGDTVAHCMAEKGYLFSPEKHGHILSLKGQLGVTVAHVLVEKICQDIKFLMRKNEEEEEIQKLRQYLEELAEHENLMRLEDSQGWHTVAHKMAAGGFVFDPDRHRNVLMLSTFDETVAHIVARENGLFDEKGHLIFHPDRHKDILLLRNIEGKTVLEYATRKFDPIKAEDYFSKDRKALESYVSLMKKEGLTRTVAYEFCLGMLLKECVSELGLGL